MLRGRFFRFNVSKKEILVQLFSKKEKSFLADLSNVLVGFNVENFL
jgi:hypothetical protein